MPFDDLAQIRAEMLMRQEQPTYDDGASQLGMDPYMQTVGLFGKGKPRPVPVAPPIDIQRRAIFGLKPQAPLPDNLPAVRSSDVPVPSAVPVPQVPVQPMPEPTQTAPLAQLANKALNTPISRREVLKKAGQTALNQALPTPKVADVVNQPTPLSQAPAPMVARNPLIDEHLRDFVRSNAADAFGQEPAAVATSLWMEMRDSLKNKLSKAQFNNYESLFDDAMHEVHEGQHDPNGAAYELYVHMQNHMQQLSPHSLVNILEMLHQGHYDDPDVYDMLQQHYKQSLPTHPYVEEMNKKLGLVPRNPESATWTSFKVSPDEFNNYMNNMMGKQ
jgi:hypothetical protein